MSIFKNIEQEIIKALKGGEKERLTVFRGLKSDLKYKMIDKGEDLTDEETIAILKSAAKKRRDSIDQFTKGGRNDLVQQEKFGLEIIETYLPKQMTEDELMPIIKEAIEEIGADSPQKVGLVMKAVMPKVKGMADGKLINQIALKLLSK